MPELKGIKWPVQVLLNGLLVVCLGYLGVGWLMSPGTPELDEVVLKHSLGTATPFMACGIVRVAPQ